MKRITTRIFAGLLAAGLLTLTACSTSGDSSSAADTSSGSAASAASDSTATASGESAGEGDLLSQIKARGELIVATEGTWAPFTYHDENDELVGYDVEVAKLVAEQLGVTATFVEGEFRRPAGRRGRRPL